MSQPAIKKDHQSIIRKIQESRKYRDTGLPDETVEDILSREMEKYPKESDALRSTRAILHNVTAPYLGDVDYDSTVSRLQKVFSEGDDEAVRQISREILEEHDSTRERLPYLEDFYRTIRSASSNLNVILDLACGLNPFAFPFMGFPNSVDYHAYDINQPRIDLINQFFKGLELEPLAEVWDVLVNPPQIKADAAFLFKEAHRIEKRRKGASRELVQSIQVSMIFISLPNRSLDRRRNLSDRMDRLAEDIFEGLPGNIGMAEFPGETLYWVEKKNG